jgi:hypothetical protein
MRVTSLVVASLFVLGCGRETLELFPGDTDTDTDAAIAPDGGNGGLGSDAESDVSTVPDHDSGASQPDGGMTTNSDAGCQSNNDCSGENPICLLGACVQCLGASDCAKQGSESACNMSNHNCGVPCAPDGGCPSPDVCDSTGVCTDCLTSSQCPANQPSCVAEECVCLTSPTMLQYRPCPSGTTCNSDQTCR